MSAPKISKIFTSEPPVLEKPEDQALYDQLLTVRTPPRDERFPTNNQAMSCWNKYNEWVACKLNSSDKACQPMRYTAESMCPSVWVEQWDEAREEGTFTGIGNVYKNPSR